VSVLPLRNGDFKRSEKVVLVMMGSALACVVLSLLFGALGALYYVPGVSAWMVKRGVSLVQLRPLHTTFASSWIFLGAAAAAYKYLFDTFGEPTPGDMRRFKTHMTAWGLAGLAALVTLALGITSGREYLGFHPLISAVIWGGWILFAWTFISKVRKGFFARPVYVYMWSIGMLFFLWTFAEGHAYLLPFVKQQPIADLQIQWKSCGTLVASFNQMVYGSLIYLAVKKTGDESIAQSKATFGLLAIGVLNSFTNYTHHTYHLPQAHLVKWVAFGVSMLEIIILVQVFREVTAALGRRRRLYQAAPGVTDSFLTLSKRWNLFLLTIALAISVPPWNALIHGTHVVMAHAMGSELAIDSYILLAFFAFALTEIFPKREVRERLIDGPEVRHAARYLNLFLMGLVATLLTSGLTTGFQRFLGRPQPTWLDAFPYAFVFFGLGLAYFTLRLIHLWMPLFLRPHTHKAWDTQDPAPASLDVTR
jgi:nitric oxide reductase subunit B